MHPDQADLAPLFGDAARPPAAPGRARAGWWRLALGAAPLALLVVVALGFALLTGFPGASSAAPPSLPAFAAPAQAAPPLLDAGTALTQTVGAYTFVLRPVWNDVQGGGAHADANEVVLAYDCSTRRAARCPPRASPGPARPPGALPRLTTADTALPWLGAASAPDLQQQRRGRRRRRPSPSTPSGLAERRARSPPSIWR